MDDAIKKIIESVRTYLKNQEIIETPEEARLMLAFYEYDNSILTGKELCNCDDINDCDECWSVEQKLEWLKERAKVL